MARLSPQPPGKARHKLFLFFLIVIFVTPTLPSLPVEEGVSSFTPLPISGSIKSEEENIDDFSVHPSSGRWNTTSDALTDDRIVDDNLRLITVDNTTSDSLGFQMNRDLRKTDGKVEWRSKADGSGNQTEYFRDILGDSIDFAEGDEENLEAFETYTVIDGIVSAESTGFIDFVFPTANANVEVFTKFEIRIKSNISGSNIFIQNNVVGGISIGTTTIDWQTISGDVPAIWSGVITRFWFNTLAVAAGAKVEIDEVKFIGDLDFATHDDAVGDTYDWEDADLEGWSGSSGAAVAVSAAEGLLEISRGVADASWGAITAAISVDPNLFDLLKVRLKANGSSETNFRFFWKDQDATEFNIVIQASQLSSSLTEFTVDLSLESDWTDATSITLMELFFATADSGDVWVDYCLLFGRWDNVDSVIGLYDDSGIGPLLNVTTHFYSNSSIGSRYEIELLDQSGEIAYRAFSDNFTDLGDLWIRGKITYDSLRSILIVDIKSDNLTRIIKVTYPADFTNVSGRIPALFQIEITPDVFVSTFTPAISWQELTIGFIRAPFKERAWLQVDTPTDTDYLSDNWNLAETQDDLDETSEWRLVVPSLDSISGRMQLDFPGENAASFTTVGDAAVIEFYLYTVDWDDGDLTEAIFIELQTQEVGAAADTDIEIQIDNVIRKADGPTVQPADTIEVDFSISLSEDRSKASLHVSWLFDDDPAASTEDRFFTEVSMADVSSDASQEFVLAFRYVFDYDINLEVTAAVTEFEFISRDLFSDLANIIIEPIVNFFSFIFIAIGRFLAGIFKIIGDLIVLAIEAIIPFLTIISSAIANIASDIWLGIGSALDFITTAIAEIAADVATAFLAIVDDIIDFLITLVADLVDLVMAILEDVVPLLLTFFGTILVDLVDFVASIVFFWWEALGLPDLLAIVELVLDLFVELIDWLIITIADLLQFALDISWIILVAWWFICIPVQFGRAGSDPLGGIGNAVEFFFGNALPISILGFQLYLPQGLVATAWLILILPADFALFTAIAAV